MRILLVYPNVDARNGLHYPHGLGALAAAAEAAGHEVFVELISRRSDLSDSSDSSDTSDWPGQPRRANWPATLARLRPDLVACGFTTHQWPFARALLRQARDAGCMTLAGGVHATFAAESVLASDACDFVCVGEGEGALLDLTAGREPRAIANLWGADFRNPPRPLLADLDAAPVYDRRHFPMAEIGRVNAYEMTALAGRGCPYPCAYCCNTAWRELYAGQRWARQRSVGALLAELDELRRRWRVDSFYFEDDIFTLDRAWLDEFLREYPKALATPFRVYLRVGTVEFDELRRLREAGLAVANVGVEHGDEAFRRDVLGRNMTNAQIEQFFEWTRRLGIATRAFHIVGAPGETPQTLRATVELCERVAPDQVQVSLFEPYPGTKLYDQSVRDGLWRGIDRSSYFDERPALDLPTFPPDELTAAYRSFCDRAPAIEARAFDLALAAAKQGDLDLLAEWPSATTALDGDPPVARKRARIGLDERFALFAHPRSAVVFPVPPGDYVFRAGLAFDPLCLDWGGGGARFVVEVDGVALLDRRLDPKRRPADRGWQDVEASFSLARAGTLTLRTLPADGDDLTALWTWWGRPHLRRSAAP